MKKKKNEEVGRCITQSEGSYKVVLDYVQYHRPPQRGIGVRGILINLGDFLLNVNEVRLFLINF